MLPPDDFRYQLYRLFANPAVQQVAPLVVLILVPTLVLAINSYRHFLTSAVMMVFDTLAFILPWNWNDAASTGSGSSERRKLRRKQHTRSRDDQTARTPTRDTFGAEGEDGYYPGLINISGTYCFMNSTLQAIASLCYLLPQLEKIHVKAEVLDVPTPVIDSLRSLVHILNSPSSYSRAYRPMDIISALSNHNPGKHNSLFSSREHQDAQELFQLLSECVKSEASAVAREIRRDRGLGGLSQQDDRASRDLSQTAFDGLTANRRSCMECGYTEAVMHFPFDNWQLAVPRLVAACRLEDCLEEYTRLEVLNDCICRKCSMLATCRKLEQEAEKLTEASQASNDPSSSKKKRARDSRKLLERVKTALKEGRIEEDIKGVKLEKVFSKASTKQSMIARPPSVLALHLNRSMHYGHYAAKNNCRVVFPEILDLTPYTTSGQLSTQPSAPISTPPPPMSVQRSVTPTPSTYAVPRTLYRLSAVVCHYGQHSFGHYVCFRRKPRQPAAGDRRFAPPRLACPLGCDCAKCAKYGPLRDQDDGPDPARPGTGRGWLRISDDAVQECGIERVLQEGAGAFMLYYERIQQPRQSGCTPSFRSSEETVRADEVQASTARSQVGAEQAQTSAAAASSKSGERNGHGTAGREKTGRGDGRDDSRERSVDPRVVRRVSAQKTKSASATPAPPPPMSRSTSSNSAVTAVSSFSSKTVSTEASVPNGHADHSHTFPATNGTADPRHPQRPPLPPPSPSKSSQSSRLRKSRKATSHADSSLAASAT